MGMIGEIISVYRSNEESGITETMGINETADLWQEAVLKLMLTIVRLRC